LIKLADKNPNQTGSACRNRDTMRLGKLDQAEPYRVGQKWHNVFICQ